MKKLFTLLLMTILIITSAGCGSSKKDDGTLIYELSEDKSYYTVIGLVEDVKPTDIVVPSEFEGKPVNFIGTGSIGKHDIKHESITSVVVCEGIVEIGPVAFAYLDNLSAVFLPIGLNKIGNGAFKNNYRLSNIDIPSDVEYIGDTAFMCCEKIKELNLKGVKTIGSNAFAMCASLETAKLYSVEVIDEQAFQSCRKLSHVYLPKTLKSIGSSAFGSCISITEINFEGSEEEWNAIEKGENWNVTSGEEMQFKINFNVPKY